jgi:hypothetical protein
MRRMARNNRWSNDRPVRRDEMARLGMAENEDRLAGLAESSSAGYLL